MSIKSVNISFMPKDLILPKSIKTNLPTCFVGQKFIFHRMTTSTMDIARQEALKNAPEGTAVFAERQTQGRGRLKRQWLTPVGNIAVSIILYPPKIHLNSLIMLSAVAVKRSIKTVSGLECQIKWPNDVLFQNKKLCGILIETKTQIDQVDYAIIGVGINVNLSWSDLPDIRNTATSLKEATGTTISRNDLLRQLFTEIEKLYIALKNGNSPFNEWQNGLVTLGKRVTARNGDKVIEGIAESVDTDGSLMLRQADDQLVRISVGDVTLKA